MLTYYDIRRGHNFINNKSTNFDTKATKIVIYIYTKTGRNPYRYIIGYFYVNPLVSGQSCVPLSWYRCKEGQIQIEKKGQK